MPDGLRRQPEARPAARRPRRKAIAASASRSTGRSPRRWRSARCCSEGTPVRLSGQDSRRGTFSQRHAVLVDVETGERYVPLNDLDPKQADVLASTTACCPRRRCSASSTATRSTTPNMLVMWEAQFGDFANGAQVIIDQFIASAESKWSRSAGWCMLLPHGYEGQGPEHSSARLERFLQLCAEDNIQVVQPDDAGAVLPPAAPAGAARLPQAADRDDAQEPAAAQAARLAGRRVRRRARSARCSTTPAAARPGPRGCCCAAARSTTTCWRSATSRARRTSRSCGSSSSTRCPAEQLRAVLGRYRKAREWVWVQEESQNMGGWTFVEPRLRS